MPVSVLQPRPDPETLRPGTPAAWKGKRVAPVYVPTASGPLGDRLRKLADAGANPIIGVGFAYSDAVNAVAPDYPKISFAVVDGFDPDKKANDNVAYSRLRRERGLVPRRRRRGAEDQDRPRRLRRRRAQRPDQERSRPATRPVRKAVNPNIKVDVNYIRGVRPVRLRRPGRAARPPRPAMYDKGADVVYHAAGASGSGVFDAAVEAGDGKWAIGVDSDQYLTAPADAEAAHPDLGAQARRHRGATT